MEHVFYMFFSLYGRKPKEEKRSGLYGKYMILLPAASVEKAGQAAVGIDRVARDLSATEPGGGTETITVTPNYGDRLETIPARKGDCVRLSKPTRSGYYFLGWPVGRNMYQGGEWYAATGDVTLIAQTTPAQEHGP